MRILIPWSIAFLLLSLYYSYIQFPMGRSLIKGVDYIGKNKDYQAKQEFHKVLSVWPNYEPVYFNLAFMYRTNGRLREARASLRHAKMTSIINSDDLTEKGSIYYTRYDFNKKRLFLNEHVINDYLLTLLNFRD